LGALFAGCATTGFILLRRRAGLGLGTTRPDGA
jgi:hypothetical protein